MKFKPWLTSKFTVAGALLASIAALFVFQNCDNVKLSLVQKSYVVQSAGKVCAQPPPNFQELHRFMFFVDNSESMRGIDPGLPNPSKRIKALRSFIDQYKSDDNFTIAVGGMHYRRAGYLPDPTNPLLPTMPAGVTTCNFSKPRLADEYQTLQTALSQLDTQAAYSFGNSPFLSVFDMFQSCLENDIATTNGALYSLVFVTDGAPTDSTVQEIKDRVTKLVNLGKKDGDRFSRVNVFLLFLDNFNSSPDAANVINQAVKAAQDAGGLKSKAIMLDPDSNFDYSSLGLYDVPRYRLKQMIVTNLNSAIEADGTLGPDSDGDGLTDKKELELGLDPTKYSTHDMCSDLVWMKSGGRCPSSCPAGLRYLDSDHDGITDCDESMIGTNPSALDTDDDGIPDGIEFNLGLSAVDPGDRETDPDGDGASNVQEAIRGTSPFIDDRKVKHRVTLDVSLRESQQTDGTYCYDMDITGLQVFRTKVVNKNTLTYMNHDQDENIVRILLFQVPEAQPSARPLVLEAYRSVRYHNSDDGVFRSLNDISDDDFSFVNP